MTMTQMDIDAIRKRAEAATGGPWEAGTDYFGDWTVKHKEEDVAENLWPEDAEFIAHAREDVPALLAEVERLCQSLEEIAMIGHVVNKYNAEKALGVAIETARKALEDGCRFDD